MDQCVLCNHPLVIFTTSFLWTCSGRNFFRCDHYYGDISPVKKVIKAHPNGLWFVPHQVRRVYLRCELAHLSSIWLSKDIFVRQFYNSNRFDFVFRIRQFQIVLLNSRSSNELARSSKRLMTRLTWWETDF